MKFKDIEVGVGYAMWELRPGNFYPDGRRVHVRVVEKEAKHKDRVYESGRGSWAHEVERPMVRAERSDGTARGLMLSNGWILPSKIAWTWAEEEKRVEANARKPGEVRVGDHVVVKDPSTRAGATATVVAVENTGSVRIQFDTERWPAHLLTVDRAVEDRRW